MTKKPSFSDRYQLRKSDSKGNPTQKNTFIAPETIQDASHVVQMNARVTPELKERVRIHCAIADMTYQEFFDEALTYYLDRHPMK